MVTKIEISPTDISHAFNWDGEKIFKFMLEALEDANFHTEVRELKSAWNKINPEWPVR